MLLLTDDVNGVIGHCVQSGPAWFEWVKVAAQAVPAIVIGGIAGYIAYRQYHVSHDKLKLDLFEKRLKVFNVVWEALSRVAKESPVQRMANFGTPFNNILPETKFLFGTEVHEYLIEATRKWAELGALDSERADAAGTDRQKNIDRSSELRAWFFNEASEGCKVIFGQYLDFSDWK